MARKAPEQSDTKSQKATTRARSVAARRSTVRKAPTRTEQSSSRHSIVGVKTLIALVIAMAAVSGLAAFIGMSDAGEIDVAATISQRASALDAQGNTAESEAVRSVTAPSAQTPELPNGGLVGRGNKETEQQRREAQQQAVAATQSASSTDDSASSTEEDLAEPSDESEDADSTSTPETTDIDSGESSL